MPGWLSLEIRQPNLINSLLTHIFSFPCNQWFSIFLKARSVLFCQGAHILSTCSNSMLPQRTSGGKKQNLCAPFLDWTPLHRSASIFSALITQNCNKAFYPHRCWRQSVVKQFTQPCSGSWRYLWGLVQSHEAFMCQRIWIVTSVTRWHAGDVFCRLQR